MISMTPALTASVFSLALLGTTAVCAQEAGEQRTQSYRFAVTAYGNTHDLGSWSKATGLDVSWDIAEYRSGGAANVSRRFFQGNPKYGTVTLSRSSSSEADLVIVWLQDLASTGNSATLVITLLDSAGDAVVSWQLENVRPRKYTVGGLNAQGKDIAIETLVLSHEGLSVVCERSCSRSF
jgi:phage tail-like protein